MSWNRFVMRIGLAVILMSVVASLTPLVNIASRFVTVESDLKPCDAIVVLASSLMRDGTLTSGSTQRLLFGIRLFKQGLAPILVLSGPPRENTAPESTVRARIAEEMGVPPSAILEISNVRTTREEAQQIAAALSNRKLTRVLLVTESLHMLRSKMVFEAEGLNVSAAPSDSFPLIARSPEERLLLLGELFMHSAGLIYYRLAGFI